LTRRDFQQLAEKRLREAESLRRARHYEGAYHLGGLSIECALKAAIAKQTRKFDFPDKTKVLKSYDHNLSRLIEAAGLQHVLAARMETDSTFATNWLIVAKWRIESRYDVNVSRQSVDQFLLSITDKSGGVLSWLRSQW
jgi:hypothetical protein